MNYAVSYGLSREFDTFSGGFMDIETMKKRNSYYDVICNEITAYTKKSLAYGNATAWASKKDKAYKKIVPRGKVFSRLHKQEWRILWDSLLRLEDSLSTKWQKIET